jgi:hypothetical protein
MARQRTLYPALAVWEILRLLAVIGLVSYASFGVVFPHGDLVALSLLLGGGNLIVPFGALYLHFTRAESRPLRLALVAGKALGLFAAVLGFAAVFIQFLREWHASSPSPKPFFEASALFIIFLVDLIFLNLLLSLKEEADRSASSSPPD